MYCKNFSSFLYFDYVAPLNNPTRAGLKVFNYPQICCAINYAVHQARWLLWIDVDDNWDITSRSLAHLNKPKESSYKLYPNPNNGSMTLEYEMEGTDIATLSIYTIDGRLVRQMTLNSNSKSVTIDATNLNQGVYYYWVKEGEKKAKTDKLIIIK